MIKDIVVFTCTAEQESAQKLGFKTIVGNNVYKEDFKNSICIRWGMGMNIYSRLNPIRCDFNRVVNPARAIQLNVQKNRALDAISRVVHTPKIFHDFVPKGKTVVYRPTTHAAGAGFFVTNGPFEVEEGHYATEFFKTDVEYRMFFCGNKTMCARRIPNRTHKPTKYTCRSMFAYSFCETPSGLHDMTLDAARVIGLDAGAADILKVGNKFVFLEINSAVTCDWPIIINFYKLNLLKLIKDRFNDRRKLNIRP